MFTGIVEELGTLAAREGNRFRFAADVVTQDAKVGDSIAVNGCCVTVVEVGDGWWEADVVADLRPGDTVNFERSLRLADRLGGHLVQGQVDGVGKVVTGAPTLWMQAPPAIMRYLVEKGSITVDGCSLTVVDVLPDGFTVAIVPHTAEATTLGHRVPGEKVNLEVDLVAKYVERLLTRDNS